MYLELSQIFQLSAAIIGAIFILVAAYSMPLRVSVGILLVMIPFQPVETRFGSANILMTYVLFGALMLRKRVRYLPLLGPLLLVLFAYLVSISQLPPALYFNHGLHLFFVFSGLLMFVLAYNMAREIESPRYIVNLLIVANVASVIYCLIQFTVPPGEKMVFFGIDELWMHRNRGRGDPRLVGPFGTPGITAAYFMTMTVLLVYEILHSRHYRKWALITLATANVAMMIGTANRGSFLVLVASLIAFVYLFRKQLGPARAVQILVASAVVLIGMGALVATHTEFGNMFSRLERVGDFEGGLPDTRQYVWPRSWAIAMEKPWLGHGPWLASETGLERSGRGVDSDQLVGSYPHSLYLHLLVTLGVFGATCMLYFLLLITWRTYKGVSLGEYQTEYERGLVLIGVLLALAFFADQIKIEFLRHSTIDYVHFVFAMFGIFLGLADRSRANAPVRDAVAQSVPSDGFARNRGTLGAENQ